ncbi:MAG: CPXCG motif-containing cysteine-rich protein [Acidobacteriota bacterium]
MDTDAIFYCAFCGEPNETEVDPSAARRQEMVEDCQVCCRPNVLRIVFDAEARVTVEATAES